MTGSATGTRNPELGVPLAAAGPGWVGLAAFAVPSPSGTSNPITTPSSKERGAEQILDMR
jgi:hypothetical protein